MAFMAAGTEVHGTHRCHLTKESLGGHCEQESPDLELLKDNNNSLQLLVTKIIVRATAAAATM